MLVQAAQSAHEGVCSVSGLPGRLHLDSSKLAFLSHRSDGNTKQNSIIKDKGNKLSQSVKYMCEQIHTCAHTWGLNVQVTRFKGNMTAHHTLVLKWLFYILYINLPILYTYNTLGNWIIRYDMSTALVTLHRPRVGRAQILDVIHCDLCLEHLCNVYTVIRCENIYLLTFSLAFLF